MVAEVIVDAMVPVLDDEDWSSKASLLTVEPAETVMGMAVGGGVELTDTDLDTVAAAATGTSVGSGIRVVSPAFGVITVAIAICIVLVGLALRASSCLIAERGTPGGWLMVDGIGVVAGEGHGELSGESAAPTGSGASKSSSSSWLAVVVWGASLMMSVISL